MLELTVNGEKRQLPNGANLTKALDTLGFQGKHFAVAVNGDFVPRSNYDQHELTGGERLEVLSPMQGG